MIKTKKKFLCILLFLLLFFVDSAVARFNLIKEPGFEKNNPVWIEYRTNPTAASVSRYYRGGYESEYCGYTSTRSTQ